MTTTSTIYELPSGSAILTDEIEAQATANGASKKLTLSAALALISSSNVTTALGYTPVNPTSLATVATSGLYSDLTGRPSLAAVATSGSAADLSTGTLLAARMPALTGDVTTSAGAVATTLATVNSNVGSFGSATQSVALTVNAKGLVTAASASTITPAVGSITGLGTGIATALAVNVGTAGAPVINGGALGTPSSGTLTNVTGLPIGGISATGTPSSSTYLRGDGTWATVSGGSGTVTATGGSLTANAVVLGAGTTDTKVVSGITTDGTSVLTLGVAGTSVGGVAFKNATSGTATLQPPTGALGTITHTLPGVSGTLAVLGANTFTATQTITEAVGSSALVLTGATQTSSFPVINATQTWNNVATTFTGIKFNATDTASATASLLADLQVGGTSKFKVGKDGATTLLSTNYSAGGVISSTSAYINISAPSGQSFGYLFRSAGLEADVGHYVGWASSLNHGSATDTAVARNAAGVVEVNSGTAGTYRDIIARSHFVAPSSANGQSTAIKSLTELTTIAAAATTDTTIQMPANSIVLSVSVRVTTAVTCTSTFTVGDAGSAARFSTAAVSKAANSTDAGTKAGAYYNATAASIRITPDTTPTDATGRVRVTICYIEVTPPTS